MTAQESQNNYLLQSNDALRNLIKKAKNDVSFLLSHKPMMTEQEQDIRLSKIKQSLTI